MESLGIVLFIVSVILGIIIVNFGYKLYMKILDADSMYYSPKKKLIYIIIVSGVIWRLLLALFVKG